MDTKKLTFTYCNVLSEIVIAGRFLSKLCTCDIWLVDSNIVFVFFELSGRWESLDQELTVFSVEFSSCTHICSSGAGQLEYNVVSSVYWNESIEEGRWSCRSETQRLNNIGPRIDPCGTLKRTFTDSDVNICSLVYSGNSLRFLSWLIANDQPIWRVCCLNNKLVLWLIWGCYNGVTKSVFSFALILDWILLDHL